MHKPGFRLQELLFYHTFVVNDIFILPFKGIRIMPFESLGEYIEALDKAGQLKKSEDEGKRQPRNSRNYAAPHVP